jgi:hypothetical protein
LPYVRVFNHEKLHFINNPKISVRIQNSQAAVFWKSANKFFVFFSNYFFDDAICVIVGYYDFWVKIRFAFNLGNDKILVVSKGLFDHQIKQRPIDIINFFGIYKICNS